jgi:hypothetical protein
MAILNIERVSWYHTGNFAFGHNPVLPPSGKSITDEPIEVTIFVSSDNRISHMIEIPNAV